jgi:hypothetical protein
MGPGVFNVPDQLIHTDEVSQEEIGNEKRNRKKRHKLDQTFPDFFCIPGHASQLLLLCRIAIDPIFYFTENHFHKNGLRAGPAAKYPAKNHGKQNYKNHKCEKAYGENEKILRPEDHAEKDEFALQYIKHKERCVINLNKGKCKKNNQVGNTEPGP